MRAAAAAVFLVWLICFWSCRPSTQDCGAPCIDEDFIEFQQQHADDYGVAGQWLVISTTDTAVVFSAVPDSCTTSGTLFPVTQVFAETAAGSSTLFEPYRLCQIRDASGEVVAQYDVTSEILLLYREVKVENCEVYEVALEYGGWYKPTDAAAVAGTFIAYILLF